MMTGFSSAVYRDGHLGRPHGVGVGRVREHQPRHALPQRLGEEPAEGQQ